MGFIGCACKINTTLKVELTDVRLHSLLSALSFTEDSKTVLILPGI